MGVYNTESEKKVFDVINAQLMSLGYEVVRIRATGGKKDKRLQIMIAQLDDDKVISIDDCEIASNHASVLLDVENPLDCEYELEMSSPGLDRPLISEKHFSKVLEKRVNVLTKFYVDGRRKFRGILKFASADEIRVFIEDVKEEFTIPLASIQDANLIYEEFNNNKK